MDQDDYFEEHLSLHPVMGIFRGLPPDETVTLCHHAWDIGVSLVEVPVSDSTAFASLDAAVAAGRDRGRHVGVGTVTTLEQLRWAHQLGAAFSVAPGFDSEIARASLELSMPHLPGVATASEIQSVVKLGLQWVKAFPAAQLGSAWIATQRAPFPTVNFIATGGVGPDNVIDFLDAGCRAVAIGSAFADPGSAAQLANSLSGREPGTSRSEQPEGPASSSGTEQRA